MSAKKFSYHGEGLLSEALHCLVSMNCLIFVLIQLKRVGMVGCETNGQNYHLRCVRKHPVITV